MPDNDLERYRDNPAAMAAFLNEAFNRNDLSELLKSLNQVMRAQNVKALARETGLRRETLYRTFGGEIDPQLGRVMALFEGLGIRLSVIPDRPTERPPRPKLGRPLKSEPWFLTRVQHFRLGSFASV